MPEDPRARFLDEIADCCRRLRLQVEDLLGRRPVRTDLGSIADYISGRVVLITGAYQAEGVEGGGAAIPAHTFEKMDEIVLHFLYKSQIPHQ